MKPWMPVGIATALLVLVLAFALGPIDFGAAGPRENSAAIADLEERLADMDNRLTMLSVRMDELASMRSRALPELTPAPEPSEDRAREDDRISELERRLAELERAPAPESIEDVPERSDGAPLTLEELLRQISQLGKPDGDALRRVTEERIALMQELLERFPDHAGADGTLRLMISLQVRNGQHEQMLKDLDRFAPAIGLEDWQRDELAVNYYSSRGDTEGQRRLYRKILDNPRASESAVASARFFTAYSYYQSGDYDEAERRFVDLIDQYGSDPPATVRDSVQGAKNYLEKIRRR